MPRSPRCRTCPTRRPRQDPRTSSCARWARFAALDFEPRDHLELAGGAHRHGPRREPVGLALCLPERRSRDARAGARALGAGEAARPRLRAGDPAGARARAGAVRDGLPARHRAADLQPARGRAVPGRAPPRSRWPRCTTARSSTPSGCRCATRASRRASAARRAPPARTRAASSACTSSTRSRCSASSSPRTRPTSTSGSSRSRRRSSASWGCPTASSTSPSTISATRLPRSTTARRGCRARAATAS